MDGDGRTLHPQVAGMLKAAQEAGVTPPHNLTVEAARRQHRDTAARRDADRTPVGPIEDFSIDAPGRKIPVRLYHPPQASGAAPPLLVFFHGGGHVIGSLDTHDQLVRNLVALSGCVALSVDYRLAPENPFPAGVDDAEFAVRWAAENGDRLGADAGRLAVGGDSSGGNLAAAVCLRLHASGGPAACFQLLIYPVVDWTFRADSYRRYASGFGILETETMRWFRAHYFRREADWTDRDASPIFADDLSGLPPALVLLAECDVLHDEGRDYAGRLEAAGVPVELETCPGMVHGFVGQAAVLDGAVAAQRRCAEALRRAFAR